MRRVTLYESSMVGSYSLVQAERTSRSVMDDLPQPPSPQIVMLMGIGGALGFEEALEAPRGRAAAALDVPAEEGILARRGLVGGGPIVGGGGSGPALGDGRVER